ncbi:MAG: RAMP superfamily CRISPR-associated protein, partial [Anaerolineales bacterium]
MSLKLTFQIELQSDYHISAGHGTGAGVDSALQRDADGAPVIRGTTLTGLLRDGLWQLLKSDALKDHRGCQASGLPKNGVGEYCGQFKNGNQEPCPLCRIFGAPNLPKRWRIASARPASQKDKTFFADSHIEQHVRINPRMRRAEPRKLFAQEVGAASQVFTFTVISPVTNAGTLDEAAMLTAAARNVRLLGRSRRRGQGECRFKLVNVAGAENIKPDPDWQTAFLQRFDAQWLQSKPEPVSASVTASTLSHTPVENPQTYRVRLIVHADEPLLIAHRAEAGNQFASLPYVNGQTLLGAFAWRAARRYNLKDDPTYQAFMRLFRRGGIQFPNLYPAEMKTDLNPTIPAPRDLYTCKLAPGKPKHGHGLWFTTQTPQTKCQHPECGSPLQAVKGFVHLRAWKGDQDYEHKIGQTTEMHIRMEPESGRVTGGDLFGYVALDAGQYFVGDLLCQDKTDWDAFNKMTGLSLKKGEPLRIGKASSRGYGQVTAWFEEAHLDNDVWARQPLSGTVQELQLTLLTDTIIQDTWGRCATGFDHSWLKNVLDLDVAEKGIQAAAATRLVDGFNALLQL